MCKELKLAEADPRVFQVCSIIDGELSGRLSPAVLANLVHLSESRLAHLFKQNTGSSIMGYIKEQRLRRAADLLLKTDFCIKQIVSEVGLSDVSHFIRDFSRQFGATPKRFRVCYLRNREIGCADVRLEELPSAVDHLLL